MTTLLVATSTFLIGLVAGWITDARKRDNLRDQLEYMTSARDTYMRLLKDREDELLESRHAHIDSLIHAHM
jgi:hypothetical protein